MDTIHGGTVSFQRDIPIRHEVDVFVGGGGPSGIAASLAAARTGRSVFLAEGHSCFGGMGTAGLVPSFAQFSDGVNFLAAGIGKEIYEKAKTEGALEPDEPTGFIVVNSEVLKRIYDDLVVESGMSFSFLTQVIGVEAGDGHVSAAICSGKSGLFGVRAKMFVDCTGDGDLAVWAGAPSEQGDEEGNLQPGTLCSIWADIDWDAVETSGLSRGGTRKNERSRLEDAFKDKVFTHEDLHLPGMNRLGATSGAGNIGHTYGVDGTDERSVTKALIWGRKSLLEYEKYYKDYLKGYEKMTLTATGTVLGIRETRRIIGDYVLNVEDFRKRAVFDDEIGRYCYPVDIHPHKPDKEAYAKFEKEFREDLRYEDGESYGIPYRILTPKTLNNVLVAGRCVSSDRYIQGSIRVIPACFITGQAAGTAAALAVANNTDTRGVQVAELQSCLKEAGAFLPNA